MVETRHVVTGERDSDHDRDVTDFEALKNRISKTYYKAAAALGMEEAAALKPNHFLDFCPFDWRTNLFDYIKKVSPATGTLPEIFPPLSWDKYWSELRNMVSFSSGKCTPAQTNSVFSKGLQIFLPGSLVVANDAFEAQSRGSLQLLTSETSPGLHVWLQPHVLPGDMSWAQMTVTQVSELPTCPSFVSTTLDFPGLFTLNRDLEFGKMASFLYLKEIEPNIPVGFQTDANKCYLNAMLQLLCPLSFPISARISPDSVIGLFSVIAAGLRREYTDVHRIEATTKKLVKLIPMLSSDQQQCATQFLDALFADLMKNYSAAENITWGCRTQSNVERRGCVCPSHTVVEVANYLLVHIEEIGETTVGALIEVSQ